jgi:transposase
VIDTYKLQEVYRKEKDGTIKERLLMVIWSKTKISSHEIGKRLNCPHSKVLYWLNRFEKEGIDGLRTKPRSGKPPKLSKEAADRIRHKLESINCWQTTWVRDLIYKENGVTYSRRHIVRLLHSWGFERITPRKEHRLADKQEQKEFLKKPRSYWVPCQMAGT